MKVNRAQATIIKSALDHWTQSGKLDEKISEELKSDLEISTFDWKRLTKYSFWFALIAILNSVVAIMNDKFLMEVIENVFNASHLLKCLTMIALSAIFYWYGNRRCHLHPGKVFSNEAIMSLGVLSTAGAIYQLGMMLNTGSGHFSLLLLLSFIVYGVLGFVFKSKLIWIFSLASLGSWMGTETGYISGWGAYYLGMNYPLRFVLFGGLLTTAAFMLEKKEWFSFFHRSTLIMGLLYLFIALWMMSIFGNYGNMDSWYQVKQIELFHWSVIFGLMAAAAIFHGLKFGNGVTKGFGVTFLIINFYTRYFEYFWEASHKAIFFAILGISFWFIGTKAEKIWQFGPDKRS